MMFTNKKILVVVAHPDDEILGIGATINQLVIKYNSVVRVVILGEGITSRSDVRDVEKWEKELEKHRSNIYKSKEQLGYQTVGVFNFPDNRFDTIGLLDIVKVIEKEKSEFLPEIIFTHHGNDLNIDHRRTFEAVMTATRPMINESVKTILTFETPSSTEWQAFNYPNPFLSNFYFEITEENLNSKIRAMECYEYEKRAYPHPRSPKSLEIIAQRNGVNVGCSFAEAFMLIRHINNL
jgi:LmbE family N-acetylglucosaminyl deacetylase